jgi:hypothetical protein
VTGCKRVLLEPMPMRVADRERLTAVRVPSRSDGRHRHQGRAGKHVTGSNAPGEKAKADAPTADNGVEPCPEAMASS